MDITTAISTLRDFSDKAIDSGQPVEISAAFAPGDMLPQGDIGLLMLGQFPGGVVPVEVDETKPLQLAPGTSRGSRHCIPARCLGSIRLYHIDDGDDLSDLVIEALGTFDLEHPEHADHIGYPAGIYRVRHQQNAARERVID